MHKPCILMVEDEPTILHSNAEYFRAQGYNVIACANLCDARMAFMETPPDLILLDVMLTDGSGFDFCSEVRRQSSAPIIYLTALNSPEDEALGFSLGCDDYVSKPFLPNILAARVAALLRRVGSISGGRLEIPPLSVDTKTGLCILAGRNIQLTPMELRLLYYFMEHFGKRLAHNTIYESVWGMPATKGSHTVKEHVYRLRKKLDMSSPDSYFQIVSEGGVYLFGKVRY